MLTKKNHSLLVILALVLVLSICSTAFAMNVNDLPDNTLRVGNDFYSLDSNNYTFANVLASMGSGSDIYYKFGGRWFNLTSGVIQSVLDLFNPDNAANENELSSWNNAGTFYGNGDEVTEIAPETSEPNGTWTAKETYPGAMTKDFTVTVKNMEAATHFEIYVSGTKFGSRVAIDGKVTGLAMLFSDPSLFSVKFYDSPTATTPIATATCNADGKLNFPIDV